MGSANVQHNYYAPTSLALNRPGFLAASMFETHPVVGR
jgi:hypothetical protein